MHFSAKIVRAAERIGKDLKRVSREARIPYSTLRSWTDPRSNRTPGIMRAISLAKTLQVDLVWLFSDAGWPPVPYMEPPPAPIVPWPPDNITWQEVADAIKAYVAAREYEKIGSILQNFHASTRADQAAFIKAIKVWGDLVYGMPAKYTGKVADELLLRLFGQFLPEDHPRRQSSTESGGPP